LQAAAAGGHRHARDGRGADAGMAAHAAGGEAVMSNFDVQVMLTSAQAKLQTRDRAAADKLLKTVESAAQPQAPADLPLIRADQSLALAAAAVSGGRREELKTQLALARVSLGAYPGGPHGAEAKTLARAIGEALSRPEGLAALPPAQLALWSARADGWVSA
jgi:hypothetical protein